MPRSADDLVEQVALAVQDGAVLDAIRRVPRERFVPAGLRRWAYEDTSLPIGAGQTISQPTIVGVMTEALELKGGEHVLEIGTGSGYQAAVLARLAREVVTVEIVDDLRVRATRTLSDTGVRNVRVLPAGAEPGAPEHGPYDAIIVTAAAAELPTSLLEQLTIGGRMVVPIGGRFSQELVVVTRTDGEPVQRSLGGCRFVPLVGRHGHVERAPQPAVPTSLLADLLVRLRSSDCSEVAGAAHDLAAAHATLADSDVARARACIGATDDVHARRALVRDCVALLAPHAGASTAADLIRHGDVHAREAAFEALVDLGEPAFDVLVELAHERDPERRWLAYEGLRLVDGTTAIGSLIDGLHDEEFGIRWVASDGLIELGENAYAPVLEALVRDTPAMHFHRAAGRVIRRMALPGLEEAVDALAASLARDTTEVESGPLALDLLSRMR